MIKKTFIVSALSLFTLSPSFVFANSPSDNQSEANNTINSANASTKTDALNSESPSSLTHQANMVQNKRMLDEPLDRLFSFESPKDKSSKNDGFYSADEFLNKEKLPQQDDLYQGMVVNNQSGEFMLDAHAYLTLPRMLDSALLFSRLYEATGFMLKNNLLTNFEKTLVLFYHVKDLNAAINDLKTIYQTVNDSAYNVFVVPYSPGNPKAGLELLALFSALPVDSLLSDNQAPVAPKMNDKIANILLAGLSNNYRLLDLITPARNDATFIKKENRIGSRHEYNLIYDKSPIKEDMVKYLIDEISLNQLVERLTTRDLNKK